MELTLKVNDDLARKIKGLSVLTGKSASDLTNDLSHIIEGHITQQLIHAVGITPEDLGTVRSGFMQPVDYHSDTVVDLVTTTTTLDNLDEQSTNNALTFPPEEEGETWSEAEEEDASGFMAAGLGASEEEFDNYDEALPEEVQSELVLPGEDDEEEMETMPIKDKEGNDSGYDDPVMADLQEELEDGSLDGMPADDYDYDDDEREFEEDSGVRPRAKVSGVIGNDAPTGEDGYTPDVLPVDYGIDKVSSEDGRSGGAMDFFMNAMEGVQGDKTRRNNVSRKRIITDF